ncbi:MAG: O-antigen ligase family protein [Clostridia bacterium]|nr:O-antigen ligase family protein [Clostridia bacterium]
MLDKQQEINKKGLAWYWQQAVLSPYFMFLVAGISLVTHFSALDLIGFYVFACLLIFVLLTTKDGKPIMLFAFLAYSLISIENGPSNGGNYDYTYYQSPQMMQMYFVMGGAIVATFVLKIFLTKQWWKKLAQCKFNLGIIIFSICMLVNGLDIAELIGFNQINWHSDYDLNNAVVAVMELTFWFGIAYVLVVTVDWEKGGIEYMSKAMTVASCVVVIQLVARIIEQYYAGNLIGPDGDVLRGNLDLGWGVCNNIGPYIAMGIPTALYLAHKRKYGWAYYTLAIILTAVQIFVQCRTSLLSSCIVLVIGTILLLATTKYRKRFVVCLTVLIGMALVVVFFFAEPFRYLFARYFEKGFDDSGRFVLWQNGLLNFVNNPLFGTGFSPDIGLNNSTIFSNMYHNEIIQIIVCTGLVGFFGYSVHKYQVWKSLLLKPTKEKLWIALSFLNVFVMSLTDNNWFLPFVGMFYAALLAGTNHLLHSEKQSLKEEQQPCQTQEQVTQ